MKNFKHFVFANCIILGVISSCAWQQNPTPSTMDNSVGSQGALNVILHSVSQSLGGELLTQGVDSNNVYVAVYALSIKGQPAAISIVSTPNNNSYFVSLIKSGKLDDTLFAPKTPVIHSDTAITKISYDSITNPAAKSYLNSLGYNQNSSFLKRTTYFYQNGETLTLVDYIFPNQETN